jgi:hypothetical protein
MLNAYWLSIPFILQMLFMAADELYFHRKRGLPRWERIGHPLDTLTVLLCLAWILYLPPNHRTAIIYLVLAVFSCIFVTKDEPVHKRYCQATEMWLHAVLFALHPITLLCAGLLWPAVWSGLPGNHPWIVLFSGFERSFLVSICVLMLGFCIYQFVFWNLVWHPKKAVQ